MTMQSRETSELAGCCGKTSVKAVLHHRTAVNAKTVAHVEKSHKLSELTPTSKLCAATMLSYDLLLYVT